MLLKSLMHCNISHYQGRSDPVKSWIHDSNPGSTRGSSQSLDPPLHVINTLQ